MINKDLTFEINDSFLELLFDKDNRNEPSFRNLGYKQDSSGRNIFHILVSLVRGESIKDRSKPVYYEQIINAFIGFENFRHLINEPDKNGITPFALFLSGEIEEMRDPYCLLTLMAFLDLGADINEMLKCEEAKANFLELMKYSDFEMSVVARLVARFDPPKELLLEKTIMDKLNIAMHTATLDLDELYEYRKSHPIDCNSVVGEKEIRELKEEDRENFQGKSMSDEMQKKLYDIFYKKFDPEITVMNKLGLNAELNLIQRLAQEARTEVGGVRVEGSEAEQPNKFLSAMEYVANLSSTQYSNILFYFAHVFYDDEFVLPKKKFEAWIPYFISRLTKAGLDLNNGSYDAQYVQIPRAGYDYVINQPAISGSVIYGFSYKLLERNEEEQEPEILPKEKDRCYFNKSLLKTSVDKCWYRNSTHRCLVRAFINAGAKFRNHEKHASLFPYIYSYLYNFMYRYIKELQKKDPEFYELLKNTEIIFDNSAMYIAHHVSLFVKSLFILCDAPMCFIFGDIEQQVQSPYLAPVIFRIFFSTMLSFTALMTLLCASVSFPIIAITNISALSSVAMFTAKSAACAIIAEAAISALITGCLSCFAAVA